MSSKAKIEEPLTERARAGYIFAWVVYGPVIRYTHLGRGRSVELVDISFQIELVLAALPIIVLCIFNVPELVSPVNFSYVVIAWHVSLMVASWSILNEETLSRFYKQSKDIKELQKVVEVCESQSYMWFLFFTSFVMMFFVLIAYLYFWAYDALEIALT
ncbi:hypothetical protein [Microbulbifer hydrolyticus]|uniref:Glucan phosphoethanolaminetransferase (Alkaline phosphatase superfamily) n=1 Tax=Microbulbifer hydrolyticus TaxID=48074 RepID=A0A6P1TDS4_9GAMM|nr:hypothetical protein [Microbulbifer hydrolyticus]MBB5212548.1 glucan phosphoethanolaminetransferase (alkaline phosphatase superfamily) [Microbulbifer hydrolyticus]QHQ40167.1 hypothetical protein GTQ55_15055 [Microbulbifer hydrolyticus]